MHGRGLQLKFAPNARLVFAWMALGIICWPLAAFWVLLHGDSLFFFYAHPELLAFVHLSALGWINGMIFGVLYHFIPVVLHVPLASERMGWWQMGFYVTGAGGMIACFWMGRLDWPLHSFASVLWLGIFLFNWNMLKTFGKVKTWSSTGRFLYAANLYLIATITLGLFLSIHIAYPLIHIPHLVILKVHAHAGLAGWFLFVVMGVSLKIFPMFLISNRSSETPARVAFAFCNAGLLAWAVAVLLQLPPVWETIGVGMLAAGIIAFLWQIRLFYRDRLVDRRIGPERLESRRPLEFQLVFVALSFAFLGAALLAGITLYFTGWFSVYPLHGRLISAYGLLVLLPFLGLLIQAVSYKIIPVLV